MIATGYCAVKGEEKKDWNISFLGTFQVPAQLEIVDGKEVIIEVLKMSEKMGEQNTPTKEKLSANTVSPEAITAFFEENKIGLYELALKNNGSYNVALLFAGKLPADMNADGVAFLADLKGIDKKQQEEIHTLLQKQINDMYAQNPEMKDIFEIEILEFYPFEQLTNKNAEMISIGASVAVRAFKLIQPGACKVYFINKNSELYVFGIINSGQDRKLWDNMSKEMLSNARWSWL